MFTQASHKGGFIYTDEQKRRRDSSPWTFVQGVLAIIQFVVFLVSVALVINYLVNKTGYTAATASIVLKTLILYVIMVTGSIWEKAVFDQYLFAPAFYWEDVVSMAVLGLHTAYLLCLFFNVLSPGSLMALALLAYAAYAINAAQFVYKLRQARLQGNRPDNASDFLVGQEDALS